MQLKINNKTLKKINFNNSVLKTGSISSVTHCISLGLPPPKELAMNKTQNHKNYIWDFYYSGGTANLVKKIFLEVKKLKKKSIVIYFIGYKAGLLEPLSELKHVIEKTNISMKMICSSSNLLGMQKARGTLKNKAYKLKIFAKKNQLPSIKLRDIELQIF